MYTNKKRLASAVALAVATTTASAVPTIDWTSTGYFTEGAKSAASFNAPAIVVTMGAEYAVDDLIELSFSSKFLASFTPASQILAYKTCTSGSPATVVGATAAENGGKVTLGQISADTTSVTYRITASTNAVTSAAVADSASTCSNTAATLNTTVGAKLSLGTLTFDGPAVNAAQTLTGSYKATLSNGVTALDAGTTAMKDAGASAATTDDVPALLSFGAQYALDATTSSTTALLNGQIDVTASPTRSRFTGTGTDVTDDVLTIDIDEATSTLIGGVATTVLAATRGHTDIVTAVVTGDWSFIVDENTTTTGVQTDAVSATCNGNAATSTTIAADLTSATVLCADGDVGNIVMTFETDKNGTAGNATLLKGAYTMGSTMTYIDSGTDLNASITANNVAGTKTLAASGTSAGAWTLNGSTSKVQAYPVGTNVEQFLWVTNTGANAGDISMTATQGGAVSAECSLGSAAAKSLTSVSTLANACLTTAGITSGRAQLSITVNAAASLVNVYAAYKVSSADDRLALTVTDGITD